MVGRVKRSKEVTLTHIKTKQGKLKKEQFRITLPVRMIKELGWKAKDKLKVWINPKKHIEIRKK